MKHFFVLLFSILMLSCSNYEPIQPTDFQEADRCTEYVTMHVNTPSRAESLTGIDTYTATRCNAEGDITYVSYHGRNGEQIGMIQAINNRTMTLISELEFPDSRVNFVHYYNKAGGPVLYVGVDRKGKDGIMCGIVPVRVQAGKFYLDSDSVKPYKVEGMSVNCIKLTGNDVLLVASGGNEGLKDKPAGFTKFLINTENSKQLGECATQIDSNYRGYWLSYDLTNKTPATYTYRTVENDQLIYKLGIVDFESAKQIYSSEPVMFKDCNPIEVEVYRDVNTTNNYNRFGTSYFKAKGKEFVLVATGTKEAGVQLWQYQSDSLKLVDTWHKSAVCTTQTVDDNGEYYTAIACGDGIYKVKFDLDNMRIIPVKKRVAKVLTESGTVASTNYVQIINKRIHVAGGYEGYYILNWDDEQFTDCDNRTDI